MSTKFDSIFLSASLLPNEANSDLMIAILHAWLHTGIVLFNSVRNHDLFSTMRRTNTTFCHGFQTNTIGCSWIYYILNRATYSSNSMGITAGVEPEVVVAKWHIQNTQTIFIIGVCAPGQFILKTSPALSQHTNPTSQPPLHTHTSSPDFVPKKSYIQNGRHWIFKAQWTQVNSCTKNKWQSLKSYWQSITYKKLLKSKFITLIVFFSADD